MIWGSEAYPLAVYELFIFFACFIGFFAFLILLFPILLFLFFGQALNFSLVVPEPKILSRSFRGGGGGGGGGGEVRGSGATRLLAHTSICS